MGVPRQSRRSVHHAAQRIPHDAVSDLFGRGRACCEASLARGDALLAQVGSLGDGGTGTPKQVFGYIRRAGGPCGRVWCLQVAQDALELLVSSNHHLQDIGEGDRRLYRMEG